MSTVRRLALSAVMRQLSNGANDPFLRRVDQRILNGVAAVGGCLGFREAHRLREPWALDLAYLLANSIASTPPGQVIQFTLPVILTVAITTECPFGCTTCYSDSHFQRSDATYISPAYIGLIAASRVPVIMLTGGEPLIHPNIVSICAELLRNGRKLILATNSYHAGLESVFRSHPHRVTALLSVWGNEETHDSIRGAGSLRSTRDRVTRYIKAGARCSLNLIIADRSASCLDEARRILALNPDVHRIFVTRAIHVGRAVHSRAPLTGSEIASLQKKCAELSGEFDKPFLLTIPELQRHPDDRRDSPLMRYFSLKLPMRCGTGFWTMHVATDGSCFGCFGLEHTFSSINISKESVHSAWEKVRSSMKQERAGTQATCLAEDRQSRMVGTEILRVLR
jgi:MoaA/NifB/PqqE/SkfB family radical SAM enzyme